MVGNIAWEKFVTIVKGLARVGGNFSNFTDGPI